MGCWVIRSSSSLGTNVSKGGQHPDPCNRALWFPSLLIPFKIPCPQLSNTWPKACRVWSLSTCSPEWLNHFLKLEVTAAGNCSCTVIWSIPLISAQLLGNLDCALQHKHTILQPSLRSYKCKYKLQIPSAPLTHNQTWDWTARVQLLITQQQLQCKLSVPRAL